MTAADLTGAVTLGGGGPPSPIETMRRAGILCMVCGQPIINGYEWVLLETGVQAGQLVRIVMTVVTCDNWDYTMPGMDPEVPSIRTGGIRTTMRDCPAWQPGGDLATKAIVRRPIRWEWLRPSVLTEP